MALCRLVCFIFLVYVTIVCAQDDSVKTKFGTVQGVLDGRSRAFLGVPFAAPPIGPLRWKPPQDPTSWTDAKQTTVFPPGCPQVCNLPAAICPTYVNEDCLYLSVFTPANANSASRLPVTFFIPGGAYEQGAGGVELFDSRLFVNHTNVIMVTINYRLGALGFLATKKIQANLGVLDQIKALKWVQENIMPFGGDPNQVTIMGQSAGGLSVATLLVSPPAQGLFHKAVIQSSPFSLPLKSISDAIVFGDTFTERAGCTVDDLQCLMSLSIDKVMEAQMNIDSLLIPTHILGVVMQWGPVVGTLEVPADPFSSLAAGQVHNPVPVLLGSVSEEAVLFVYRADANPLPLYAYDAGLVLLFGFKNFDGLMKTYPVSASETDARPVLAQLGTDFLFTCPTRHVARGLSEKAKLSVYLYQYQHVDSIKSEWGANYSFCGDAVCHGAELSMLFNSAQLQIDLPHEEVALSFEMAQYWASFARSATPNQWEWPIGQFASAPLTWPEYAAASDDAMLFVTPSNQVQPKLRKMECDFWDSIGYKF